MVDLPLFDIDEAKEIAVKSSKSWSIYTSPFVPLKTILEHLEIAKNFKHVFDILQGNIEAGDFISMKHKHCPNWKQIWEEHHEVKKGKLSRIYTISIYTNTHSGGPFF